MKVIQIAKHLNTTADTVRYYTRIGYLKPNIDKGNGYQSYGDRDIQRLRFVLSARRLGFSVDDIGAIIKEADKGKSPCTLARQLITQRLEETEKSFNETIALRKRMQAAVKEWKTKPDKQPTGNVVCHLIENFYQP